LFALTYLKAKNPVKRRARIRTMIRGFLFSIAKKSSDFDVSMFIRDLVEGRKDPKRKKRICALRK
jgi:hypothetical protein